MITTSPTPKTRMAAEPRADAARSWIRVLVWVSVVAAAFDLIRPALVGEVIPPLAVGAVLTVVGLLLLPRRRRAGVAVLGVTSLLVALTSAPFAVPELAHPSSPLTFAHSFITVVGRLLAVAAAVGAWWQAPPARARRLGIAAAGLLAVTLAVGAVSAALMANDPPMPGDVTVPVRKFAFPAEVRVTSGGGVHVNNADLARHTFSVVGTDVSHELPELRDVRFSIDVDPGRYQLICAVPGHESMTARLVVE